MRSVLLGIAVFITLVACGKTPDTAPAAPSNPSAAAPVPGLRDAKTLINDAKAVAGYAAFQQEMAPHSKMALEAYGSGSRSKDDPRLVEYGKLNEAALAKAGLSQSDISTMSRALSTFVAKLMLVRGAAARPGSSGSNASRQSYEEAKQEFVQQYGQVGLDNVLKYEKELCEAHDALMKAALGK